MRENAIRELHLGHKESLQLSFVSRGPDYHDKEEGVRKRERREFSILLFFINTLQDTSVVDNTVSSSRLRTASVTMVS